VFGTVESAIRAAEDVAELWRLAGNLAREAATT